MSEITGYFVILGDETPYKAPLSLCAGCFATKRDGDDGLFWQEIRRDDADGWDFHCSICGAKIDHKVEAVIDGLPPVYGGNDEGSGER